MSIKDDQILVESWAYPLYIRRYNASRILYHVDKIYVESIRRILKRFNGWLQVAKMILELYGRVVRWLKLRSLEP